MTDGGAGVELEMEPEPSVERVHEIAIRSARRYSPRCPAEDIAQDVVEKWLRQDPKPAKWKGWVVAVTRNQVHDVMGRQPAAKELAVDFDAVDDHRILGVALFGPSAAVIAREQLRRLLGNLPPAECRVLVASLDGLTNAEIAEAFGYANSAAVATVLSNAKGRIRAAHPDVDWEILPQRLYDV
ncbi:MAG TPA: hypothetical protein VHD81_04250 [Mycobacteriales bacterium]|nr:hypothetical protein [Mycobacteriales bacterium]